MSRKVDENGWIIDDAPIPKPKRPPADIWINASAMWDAYVPSWADDWSGFQTPISLLLQWIADEAEEYGIRFPQVERDEVSE